ncbi:uncharacterized protein [Populus alba]|uniref:uncharacterized protein n=1 Tax=Populus alba TaxID=43335 RepID=UPI003CC6F4BF
MGLLLLNWRNLFASNHNTVTCPKLIHYSAFTETNRCDLVGDDLDAKCDFWKLCLVGYVARRSPGYKALQNIIVNSWKLWVKFPNLQLQCWSLKCLSKIASVLRKPVQSDMLTHTMLRLSYAKVLVEVNLLSDLPYSIDVNLPNGSLLKQQVIYETLPRFCKHCRTLGHLTSTCPKSVPLTDYSPVAPILVESELVSVRGDVDPVSSGWNIVQSKRMRRKPSPPKHNARPSHVDHCTGPESTPVHALVDSRDHRFPAPPSGSHIQTGPNTNVLAGSRYDKGKSVVVSVAPGLPSSGVSSAPLRRKAQSHTGGASGRATSTTRIVVFWNPVTVNIDLFGYSAQGLHVLISSLANKHRGEPVSTYETADFRQCCSDLGLADLNYSGSHFTWSNGSVWSKLDRVLANPLWSLSHTLVHVHFDNPGAFSDHSPATVSFYSQQLRAPWGPLRELNKLHFSHISERVARAEAALSEHQTILSSDMNNVQLHAIDKHLRQSLLHLKACERQHRQNCIPAIQCSDGTLTSSSAEVGAVFVDFYCHLLRTPKETLPLDIGVIQHSPCLDVASHASLLAPVSDLDIKNALFAIDDGKAPGPDGYSSCFFKKSWSVIHEDFCLAVRDFFQSSAMLKQINHSIIALIPKSANTSSASDFHPISCCNVIYKVIVKLFAVRLSQAFVTIISPMQNAFLGGRLMLDNIHLLQELLRNYERKHTSPRCLMKIDFKKAFDLVQWPFLRQLLLLLGFPSRFVQLVMQCVETASYSVAVNGSIYGFFPGKNGVRQGDPLSPYLFLQLVTFGKTLGLDINANKSSIYFGGVSDSIKHVILEDTSFTERSFPFRYLGVPLSPHRLLASQFSPLLHKLESVIHGWMGTNLSYARRAELLKSVLYGMVQFWLNIFSFLEIVIKQVTRICRNFFWTGNTLRSKSALVKWHTVCLPKTEGGLGFFDIKSCNNSFLAKLIWNIHLNTDSIWIKWVHHYYLLYSSIWDITAHPTSSPLWKSIISFRNNLCDLCGGQPQTLSLMAQWSSSKGAFSANAYDFLRFRSPPVHWRKVVWEPSSLPWFSFILWLAILATCLAWLSYMDNGSLFQTGELIPSWLPLALGIYSSLKLDRSCGVHVFLALQDDCAVGFDDCFRVDLQMVSLGIGCADC